MKTSLAHSPRNCARAGASPRLSLALCAALAAATAWPAAAQAPAPAAAPASRPQGEIQGTAWVHTTESLRAAVEGADLALPAALTGAAPYFGKFKDAPRELARAARPVPVVLFLHGSSGLSLKAIGEWQQWLASLGVASIAPDSFALPQRVSYKSPIERAAYERVHALRLSEIAPTLAALRAQPWADAARLVLAGTSEGAVPVSRWRGNEFAARMVFAWSCENNYFVQSADPGFEAGKPVLNIISASDPFFSRSNGWLDLPAAAGHCGAALKGHAAASVLLVPDAPHTLLNLPAVRQATAGFLAAHVGAGMPAAPRP